MTTRSPLYQPFPGAITLDTLDRLFDHHRPTFGGFRMEGDDDQDKPDDKPDADKSKDKPDDKDKADKDKPDDKDKQDKPEDHGFPSDTPVERMSEKEQLAYYRYYAQKHEARNKSMRKITGGRVGDDLRADMEELAKLRREKMSDEERKVADARDEGRREVLSKANEKVGRLAMDVALSHVDDERRKVLLEGFDLTKVFDGDELDTDKVQRYATALAPRSDKDKKDPDYGGGRRGGSSSSGVAAGSSRYQERHAKRRGKQKTDA